MNCCKVSARNQKRIDHLEDVSVDGLTLKLTVDRLGDRVWTRFMGSRQGPMVGSCEHAIKTSGAMKVGDFFGQLSYN
jgi:hypothetical protein